MRLRAEKKALGKTFRVVDSHTMGEPTRVIYDVFPELHGSTMMERKEYLEAHYDHYRRALMLEPRGHRDMFGALLTEPVSPEADLGVIFMDCGDYLNMCGHGSIGSATVAVETGMVAVSEPYTEVVLEAPVGLIRARVKVENGRAVEVSILNVPSCTGKTCPWSWRNTARCPSTSPSGAASSPWWIPGRWALPCARRT